LIFWRKRSADCRRHRTGHFTHHNNAFLEEIEQQAQALFPTTIVAREGLTLSVKRESHSTGTGVLMSSLSYKKRSASDIQALLEQIARYGMPRETLDKLERYLREADDRELYKVNPQIKEVKSRWVRKEDQS
jgi:hypothetical protein